jgi:hypothetical protein
MTPLHSVLESLEKLLAAIELQQAEGKALYGGFDKLTELVEPTAFYDSLMLALKRASDKEAIQVTTLELAAHFFYSQIDRIISSGGSIPRMGTKAECGMRLLLEDCFPKNPIGLLLDEIRDWGNRTDHPTVKDYRAFLRDKLMVMHLPITNKADIFSIPTEIGHYQFRFWQKGSVEHIDLRLNECDMISTFNRLCMESDAVTACVCANRDFKRIGKSADSIEFLLVDGKKRLRRRERTHGIQRMPDAATLLYLVFVYAFRNKVRRGKYTADYHDLKRMGVASQDIYNKLPAAANEAFRALSNGQYDLNSLGIESIKGKKKGGHKDDDTSIVGTQPFDLHWNVCVIEQVLP